MINSEIFKDILLSQTTISKAVDFLGKYKTGEYLYPNVLIRNLRISKGDEIWITKVLTDNNLVDVMHYYICPRCGSTTNFFSKEYLHTQYPVCENCEEQMDINDYRVVYRIK